MKKLLVAGFAVNVTSWLLTALCGAFVQQLVSRPPSSRDYSPEGFVMFSVFSLFVAVPNGLGFGIVILICRAFTFRFSMLRIVQVSVCAGVASALITCGMLLMALRWPGSLPFGFRFSVVLQLAILAPLVGGTTGVICLSIAQWVRSGGERINV
jgi:hypothetical protein